MELFDLAKLELCESVQVLMRGNVQHERETRKSPVVPRKRLARITKNLVCPFFRASEVLAHPAPDRGVCLVPSPASTFWLWADEQKDLYVFLSFEIAQKK